MPRISGSTGNFTTTDHKFDASSFSLAFDQQVDAGPSYNDTTWVPHQGAGIIAMSATIGGFAKDNAASSSINADGMSATGSTSTTFTLNTGTTYAGTLVVSSITIDHARNSGFVPVSVRGNNAGTITETWDETA